LPLETPSPGDGSYLQNYTNSSSVIDVPSTGAPSKKVLCVPDAITVLYVYLKRRIHYVDLKKKKPNTVNEFLNWTAVGQLSPWQNFLDS